MATVNTQDNPSVAIQGAQDSDITIITSQITTGNLVQYQIEKIATQEVLEFDNSAGMRSQRGGNLIDVNRNELRIILESRTRYRARARAQFGDWSAWVNFTTRDKRYQSPHAVTQLTDDTNSTAQTQGTKTIGHNQVIAQGGSRTIVVTNSAKATETDNTPVRYNKRRNWGPVTVVNTDTIYNDGQLQKADDDGRPFGADVVPIKNTNRGATVINVPAGENPRITYTDRGATINATA